MHIFIYFIHPYNTTEIITIVIKHNFKTYIVQDGKISASHNNNNNKEYDC